MLYPATIKVIENIKPTAAYRVVKDARGKPLEGGGKWVPRKGWSPRRWFLGPFVRGFPSGKPLTISVKGAQAPELRTLADGFATGAISVRSLGCEPGYYGPDDDSEGRYMWGYRREVDEPTQPSVLAQTHAPPTDDEPWLPSSPVGSG